MCRSVSNFAYLDQIELQDLCRLEAGKLIIDRAMFLLVRGKPLFDCKRWFVLSAILLILAGAVEYSVARDVTTFRFDTLRVEIKNDTKKTVEVLMACSSTRLSIREDTEWKILPIRAEDSATKVKFKPFRIDPNDEFYVRSFSYGERIHLLVRGSHEGPFEIGPRIRVDTGRVSLTEEKRENVRMAPKIEDRHVYENLPEEPDLGFRVRLAEFLFVASVISFLFALALHLLKRN